MSEATTDDSSGQVTPERWKIPAIDGSSGNGYLTAGRLQELQRQAWDEAYEVGHAAGVKSGQEAVHERAARFDQLLIALATPFENLDDEVDKQLVELAMTVVKQLFRRELRLDPTHIIGVVRDAIKLLPIASRNIQVHLHSEDAALVQESLSLAEGEQSWTIVEDPLIGRGGCVITTNNSKVDAQAETRLKTIISAIVGDERNK